MTEEKKKTGTKEWVSKSLNIQDGCPYNCKYPCYARCIRRKKEKEWGKPKLIQKWFNQKLENYEMGFLANVMCFSLHDIYPENQMHCKEFILRILKETDNTILIVSKANLDTIKYLCESLYEYKSRIKFMITITSMYDSRAVKFEPYAPLITERILAVEYLDLHNWGINISIEPFLDRNPHFLVERLIINYGNIKTVWIGCNSFKKMKIHEKLNLLYIQKEIAKFPNYAKEIIYYKNSFLDKLEGQKYNKNSRYTRITDFIEKGI